MAPMPINDSMFLLAERREQPMHVGGLQVFELPPDAPDDWLLSVYQSVVRSDPGQISSMFRRRPVRPASSLGAWSWQTDRALDLEHHVRLSALPRPGRVRELLALVSRLHGTLLDRHRPLWEAHLIEGLDGRRFGVYTKVHHSLLDGVSALRLLAKSLSADASKREMPLPFALEDKPSRSSGPGRSLAGMLGIPVSALRTTYELAELGTKASTAAARSFFDSNSHLPTLAPRTILNQPITGARRFAAQSWDFGRVRAVADATGTTINDVVLAMCSGALRAYLMELGELPDAPLVAMTPVSLRSADSDIGGNAVGALLCNLATDRAGAGERLAGVHESMDSGKALLRELSPTQATVASAIAMSPMLLGQIPGLRRVASPGYNVVISNIPGPKETMYWNGARLQGAYPLSIPTDGQALNITVTSYARNLEFGLTGCRQRVPHLQRLLTQLEDALAELEKETGISTSGAAKRRRNGRH
jgi:diacylglycerol O-acyltransferase